MTDYQARTIARIRQEFPAAFSMYLDEQIARAYNKYCELFHAASWTEVDLSEFVHWATTPPIACE